jgi:hypothetical protein
VRKRNKGLKEHTNEKQKNECSPDREIIPSFSQALTASKTFIVALFLWQNNDSIATNITATVIHAKVSALRSAGNTS